MKLQIKAFGELAEMVRQNELEGEHITDLKSFQEALLQKYPALSGKTFRFAVNGNLAELHASLNTGDEVVLLPPFSGG
ncbi:MAG: MoaD/ThiS family protein [Bacteroidia bacterium]|jgi:molybdopterin converting factor small subunit